MRLETFFEKFDLLANAPDAVATMRELILALAMQGRLVPNDPREEPVGLELSGNSNHDSEYPLNWRSGLLGDAFIFEYGDNLPAPKRTGTGQFPVYGSNGIVGTHDNCLTEQPAIVVGRKGSAGALNIAPGPSWTTDVAYYVVPPPEVDLRFTYILFSSLHLDELGKGIKPGLSRKEAYALPIALPPLAEQKRIVAKVDELMALCDRLEVQQQERETRHAGLARASLARFADAPTPANLEFLFHPSYTISPADLRKSILTLAVQGKLVRQDSFKRARKTQSAQLMQPTHEQALPDGWRLELLSKVAAKIIDCPHSTPKWAATGRICVRTNQFRPGALHLAESRFVSEETFAERIRRLQPQHDDILYSREGGILGVACRVPPNVTLCLGQRMILIRAGNMVEPTFLELVLNSPLITAIALRKTTGGAAPRVNVSTIRAYPIPVPPLDEQRRIVAKVDQLTALIDELESQLTTSRATAANLMEAVVAELTSHASLVPTPAQFGPNNKSRAKNTRASAGTTKKARQRLAPR